MNLYLKLAFLYLGVSASSLMAADSYAPKVIPAPVEKIFIPLGFDDNDDVEVILHGHFLNNCQKIGKATAVQNNQTFEIQALVYQYQGEDCVETHTPYIQSLKLGVLKSGSYMVRYPSDLNVAPAALKIESTLRSEPDDYLYPLVFSADLVANESGGYNLNLEGTYPAFSMGCMQNHELRLSLTPGNVVVVQPISIVVKTSQCKKPGYSNAFKISKAVNFNVVNGDYLIHVRELNGNSYNRLKEVK